MLQGIDIFLSKFTSPLISGTLSEDADFSPTLLSLVPLFHRIYIWHCILRASVSL